MKNKAPLESDIQRTILDWLKVNKVFHWRQNNQGRTIQRGSSFVRIPTAGIKGVSDILGVHRRKFFALEVKRPGEKPTIEQEIFLAELRAENCVAELVYSLDDTIKVFKDKF